MTPKQLSDALDYLGLNQVEAGKLLQVTARSVNRWYRTGGIPRHAANVLDAWCKLKRNAMSWRPGAVALGMPSGEVDQIIKEVQDRGGAASPWAVDVEREEARLGPIQISFSRSGSTFWPLSYERSDASPDLDRDRHLIEDGICRIALTLSSSKAPAA